MGQHTLTLSRSLDRACRQAAVSAHVSTVCARPIKVKLDPGLLAVWKLSNVHVSLHPFFIRCSSCFSFCREARSRRSVWIPNTGVKVALKTSEHPGHQWVDQFLVSTTNALCFWFIFIFLFLIGIAFRRSRSSRLVLLEDLSYWIHWTFLLLRGCNCNRPIVQNVTEWVLIIPVLIF